MYEITDNQQQRHYGEPATTEDSSERKQPNSTLSAIGKANIFLIFREN